MRKPALTNRMADLLLTLASYSQCEAEEISTSPCADQRQLSRDVNEASEWIARLANWKLRQTEE